MRVMEWLMKWRVVDWIRFLLTDGMIGEGMSGWLNESLISDTILSVVVIDGLIDWGSAMSTIISYEWDYIYIEGVQCLLL